MLQVTGALPTPISTLADAVPLCNSLGIASRSIVPGTEPFLTGWVCGAVFPVRTDLMHLLSGFDPRFFLYWEETDVCRRATDAGFEVWAVGTPVAHHVAAAISSKSDGRVNGCITKHFFQSRRCYMIKHHGWVAATAAELG